MTQATSPQVFSGLGELFLSRVKVYLPFTEFLSAVMDGDSELTNHGKEKIALYVSRLNGCEYCVRSHQAVLEAIGRDRAEIDAAEAGSSECERLQAAFFFARTLTQSPGAVMESDIEALLQAGWNTGAVVEIVNITTVFCLLNRLTGPFQIEGSEQEFSGFGAMVAESGYAPLTGMLREAAASG